MQHIFRAEEERPLEIVYCFPLPRDAALRRFRIVGEGFEAHSELKETEDALKAYEEGISRGSLAALARQYGDGLINLNVGNIRPGETVSVYLEILAGVELRDDVSASDSPSRWPRPTIREPKPRWPRRDRANSSCPPTNSAISSSRASVRTLALYIR